MFEQDYEWFKKEFYKLTKIDLSKYKEGQMKRRIDTYIFRRFKTNYYDFITLISSDDYELRVFAEYLTINVSEFFRNIEQWDVLENDILPIIKDNKHGILKIWSSACSSGEEPYSLAMLLNEVMPSESFEIIATDLDLSILERARNARYRLSDLSSIPVRYHKYFVNIGHEMYTIVPEIKNKVSFSRLDLLCEPYPDNIDLLVCRNVLIYFVEDAKEAIYNKFSNSLRQGGVLFVGSSEQIVTSRQYNLEAIRTYFYRKM